MNANPELGAMARNKPLPAPTLALRFSAVNPVADLVFPGGVNALPSAVLVLAPPFSGMAR